MTEDQATGKPATQVAWQPDALSQPTIEYAAGVVGVTYDELVADLASRSPEDRQKSIDSFTKIARHENFHDLRAISKPKSTPQR